MKILISNGHNPFYPNYDSGAVGQGQQESLDNIRIGDRVVLYLRAWGIETIYMPNNVGDLTAEIKWANANLAYGQGYAIQIHRNAFNGQATGNEVWTTDYGNQMPLARSIMKAMTEFTGLAERGVKDIKDYSPLGWITGLNAESVLIEARFIDHDDISDAEDMEDAYAIACGIADFLKVPRGKSEEQKQIEAARAAAAAQAAAKAEADRLAKLAEQARIDADIARINKEIAEAAAKKAAEEKALADKQKADADKALKDAVSHTADHSFLSVLKELWNLIWAFITLKGKQ
jgi:hypothetical protein